MPSSAVIDESVFARAIGGPDVMATQTQHLLDLPNVTVRVLPFAAGLRRAHMGHFMILKIPAALGSDLVYIEGHAGETVLENESDVDLYRDVFDDVLARALDVGATREVIRRCAYDHAPRGKAPS